MVAELASGSTAVLNADDAFVDLWRGMTRAHVVTFGFATVADFRADDLDLTLGSEGFLSRFTLTCPLGSVPVELHFGGRHNVANALAAAAAAASAGASLAHVAQGLSAARPMHGRLQFKQAIGNAWIIDDSYNANPSSVRSGIEVLASLTGRRWLVLGDMAELGACAETEHLNIGAFAREQGIERLYATGPLAAHAVERFGAGARWFPETEALANALRAALEESDSRVCMLVKGSRINRLERVVAALAAGGEPPEVH